MNQQQRFRRKFSYYLSARELARNSYHCCDYGAYGARIDRHRAAKGMADQGNPLMPSALEKRHHGDRVEDTFVEFIWLPIIHPRDRKTLMGHDQAQPGVEHRRSVEASKRAARNAIYANRYIEFANKYFGQGMTEDARRCYLAAIRHRSSMLFRLEIARRLLGTIIGLRAYELIKQVLRSGRARKSL